MVVMLALIAATSSAIAGSAKVVLQLTDGTLDKHSLVLAVAENLLAHYGDEIELEIVAFGPGLPMLFADADNAARVDGLAARGVRFAACRNTHKKLTKVLGKEPLLSRSAREVEAGAARIIELVNEGYVLLRP
ncbi:MAG: hypothetical protein AMJ69_03050 [Gammaproteobacteria bacterium SG8_47]|nr:MAG: hypothetical protein AMJ69_03050 [Gammaproteobacteria bacterium SG8_47]